MNIYVKNIASQATELELKQLFQQYGEVSSAKIIIDKMTQRSRGFGFIEMPDTSSAQTAMTTLNGFALHGRDLTVTEARPKPANTYGANFNNPW